MSINDEATFQCNCTSGYEEPYCNTTTNMCKDIVCENGAICQSDHKSWKCECLGSSLYSGLYCQDKSFELIAKEILSKSFSVIAILSIAALFLFVFTMDVLKYVFEIDPVDRERRLMRLKQMKKLSTSNKKKRHRQAPLKTFYIT